MKKQEIREAYLMAQTPELSTIIDENINTNSKKIFDKFEEMYLSTIEREGSVDSPTGLLLNAVSSIYVKENYDFEGRVHCMKEHNYFNRVFPLIGYHDIPLEIINSQPKDKPKLKPKTSHDHILMYVDEKSKLKAFGKITKEEYNTGAYYSEFDENRICIHVDRIKKIKRKSK